MFTQIATQKHKALGLPSETLKPEFLRSFLQNLSSEIAPVTAILGGQLAQDVINVLGRSQQPIQNMVIFDGVSMESLMYPLHPEGNLGVSLLSGVEPLIPNGGGMMMPGAAGFDLSNFDVSSFVAMQGPNSMATGSLSTNGLPMNAFPSQVPQADTNVGAQASNYHIPQNGAASGTPQPNGQAAGTNRPQGDAP
jgi:ubiquitin-like 1-activating enzyme E1 A